MKQKDLSKYKKYAEDVLAGNIVACRHIHLACKRYLSWFDREDMYFDSEAADKVINFCGKFKHVKGSFAGQKVVLADWQEWIVYSIFGFKWKKNDARVVRRVYLEVGRKQGKSTLAALLSLYAMIADGEASAEVVFASNSAKQASLCFSMAKDFIQPYAQNTKIFKTYRASISFPATHSVMEVVSADASKLEGKNCSFFICDELAQAKDGLVYNTLATSQGMRSQPLSVVITTAGFDRTNFCFQMRQSYIDVLEGLTDADNTFAAIYTLDEGDDPLTDNKEERLKIWKKSNPNLNVTVSPDFLQQELNDAKNNSALMASCLTRYFNLWLSSSKEWISADIVSKSQEKWDFSDFPNEWLYGGLDLAAVNDLTCVSLMLPHDDMYYFRNYYFLPVSALDTSENKVKYRQWQKQGYLIVTPQKATDYDYVLNEIKKVNKDIPITKIAYDPWHAQQFVNDCQMEAFNMTPFSQTIGNMSRPTSEMARLMINGKVRFYPNPIDSWCFANVGIKEDYNANQRPVKGGGESQKIDGVVASIVCLGGYLQEQYPQDFSIVGIK